MSLILVPNLNATPQTISIRLFVDKEFLVFAQPGISDTSPSEKFTSNDAALLPRASIFPQGKQFKAGLNLGLRGGQHAGRSILNPWRTRSGRL
jgi:hypothetical protein